MVIYIVKNPFYGFFNAHRIASHYLIKLIHFLYILVSIYLDNQTNIIRERNQIKMNHLPMDIVNNILEYQGYHVFRNGKFMCQIPKTDARYALLKKMPKKQKLGSYSYCVTIYKKDEENQKILKHEITANIHAGKLYWSMRESVYDYSKIKYIKWMQLTEKLITFQNGE